jgi:hypothetical protein
MAAIPQQKETWTDRLKSSSWLTIAWDWFMNLMARAVEPVLWVTLIFSCYQLIPQAPPAPAVLVNLSFILQFIALDVGGAGLLKLAQAQELPRWSYPRLLAYALIGVTLFTVSYAGLQHVLVIDAHFTIAVEVALVVIRSILTVLYGQAIHAMKQTDDLARETLSQVRAETVRERAVLHDLRETVSRLKQEQDECLKQRDDLLFQSSDLKQQIEQQQAALTRMKQSVQQPRQALSAVQEQLASERDRLVRVQAEVQAQLASERERLIRVQADAKMAEATLAGLKQQEMMAREMLVSLQTETDRLQEKLARMKQREVSVSSRGETRGETKKMAVVSRHETHPETTRETEPALRVVKQSQEHEGESTRQIETLLREGGLTVREIAARVGCSPATVTRRKQAMERERAS